MIKKFIFGIILSLLIPFTVFAANTTAVSTSNLAIQITGLDADWYWETEIAASTSISQVVKQAKIKAIIFYPSAANDRLIIHDGGLDTAAFFDSGLTSAAADPRIIYYVPAKQANLVIDISDCTMNIAANCKVVIL